MTRRNLLAAGRPRAIEPPLSPSPYSLVLDIDDPRAVELAKIHRVMVQVQARAVEVQAAHELDLDREVPDGPERDALRARLLAEVDEVNKARGEAIGARGDVTRKILAIVDRPDPTPAEWFDYGRPLATVRVGNRLFVVVATEQSEFYGDFGGSTELIIIDT